MIKTIFLTASRGDECKNFEHIMRIIFLSRFTEFTMPVIAGADFQRYLSPGSLVLRSPFSGKLGLIFFASYSLWKHRNELDRAIIITEPSVLGLVGFFAKCFSHIKWVVDVWDIPIRHNIKSKRLTRLRIKATRIMMKQAYKMADLFIVGIRPDFEFQYYRIPDEKLLCWQTTIWIPKNKVNYSPTEEKDHFNILCMKSMHNHACGIDILLEAFTKVRSTVPHARLWIIGKTTPDVEEALKAYEGSPGVEFLGFLDHQEVMRRISRSHVCVIPWRNDIDLAQAYPTKVMEYLTEGKVVLAPRIAAIEDMITDGHNGVLFQPGNPAELADKIMTLYQDVALRQRLAENARQYNPKFDIVRKQEEIFKSFQRLVNDDCIINVSLIDDRIFF